MFRSCLGVLGVLSATAGCSSENSAAPSMGSRSGFTEHVLAELPQARQEHAVVALDGAIYVVGGFTTSVTSSVAAYDPTTDAWSDVESLPSPLHHANAAALDGKLYVTGFYVGTSFSDASGQVFEYDPASRTWTERTAMPEGTERASSCVAALGTRVFSFGGARGNSVADASAYDTLTDSWEVLPPLPEPREHCVAAAIDGALYIASGRSGSIDGFRPRTWAYDPVAQTYTEKAPIPTPRGGAAGAVVEGRLLIFGGEGSSTAPLGVFASVEAYDPATDTWETLPDMMVPRHGFGAAVLEAHVYLPGGATRQGLGAVADHSVVSSSE